jgi:hypothetical protein
MRQAAKTQHTSTGTLHFFNTLCVHAHTHSTLPFGASWSHDDMLAP